MNLRPSPRRLVPLALLAIAGLALTACGSDSSPKAAASSPSASASTTASPTSVSADGCVDVTSGKTSDAVTATGDFGKKVTAKFKAPLAATNLERTIVTNGTGKKTVKGEAVNTSVTVYLGSGKELGTQPLSMTIGGSSFPAAFAAGAACLPLGTRSVTTALASDVYGAQGNPQAGIAATDTLVIVTDLLSEKKALHPAAWKTNRATVKFSAKGQPTVTLPKVTPPKQLELQVLRKGKGAVVKAGNSVTVDYQGTSWKTGKIFDQSYGKTPATFATDQVVEGFGAALVGQKVGTRLIVSIPAKYAYAKGSSSDLAGQALVFVIEIKAIAGS